MKYTKFVNGLCEYNSQSKYLSHYEFLSSTTNSEDKDIQVIYKFLCQLGDIFTQGNLQNLVTGEILNT